MSVEPGQITGIVGANGAGKSTLFKAIYECYLIEIDKIKMAVIY